MTTITSFLIIFLTTFLLFIFLKNLLKDSSVDFITLLTFLTFLIVGLIFVNLGVEVLPTDLVSFSVSLLLIYVYSSIKERPTKKKEDKLKEGKKLDKLGSEIYKKRKRIFKLIENKAHLEDYFYLKIEYEKGNVKSEKFRKTYKNFYNMHPFGFTDEFFKKYFQFLEEGETDLRKILNELSGIKDKKGKRSVQLAFASKLVHTVDSSMPLYNSTVADLFNLSIPKGDFDKKIDSSIEIYGKLKSFHRSLATKDSVKRTMLEFRKRNNFKEGILSDSKLIDLLIKGHKEL